jgi:hypothetical protein
LHGRSHAPVGKSCHGRRGRYQCPTGRGRHIEQTIRTGVTGCYETKGKWLALPETPRRTVHIKACVLSFQPSAKQRNRRTVPRSPLIPEINPHKVIRKQPMEAKPSSVPAILLFAVLIAAIVVATPAAGAGGYIDYTSIRNRPACPPRGSCAARGESYTSHCNRIYHNPGCY